MTAAAHPEALVARQAIFDRDRKLYAYELLYRSHSSTQAFDGTEATLATGRVISNALLSIGLEKLLCGKKAFLNFDHGLLRDGMHLHLPRETVVVEILESVDPTPDLIALCRGIHEQGYSIALDDFVAQPGFEPLTRIAELIKVDYRATPQHEQERMLALYKPRGIVMLAEKLETNEEFEWALQAGYDLFQGYFFARPVLVSGREIPPMQSMCLRLLLETQRDEIDFKQLELLIRGDVSLAFKLLRYVNSALFGRRKKTSSIGQTLVILGEDGIRRWAALATLPMLATGKPNELVTLSLVRARWCERLAQIGGSVHEGDAFLMGMFSLLDALIDCPLEQALQSVDLDANIRNALLGSAPERDVLANIYRLVQRYEEGDWDQLDALAAACGVHASAAGAAYVEATVWAERLMAQSGF
jgi:c-di-GMP-related signal transduction protein